ARHLYGSAAAPAPHETVQGIEQLDKVVSVDQSPIGRTPRSNPATYTGLFTPTRELFAGVPEARERGYDSGRFSFNVKGGRCEACQGDGVTKVEMHFLADVYVPCDVCHGKRYNRETLEIRYKGRNTHGVLARLRDAGNTVVVIEHNLDVIKTADWLIDLGPEGGDGGGQIIAQGTPEQVAANKASYTGRYLREALAAARGKPERATA